MYSRPGSPGWEDAGYPLKEVWGQQKVLLKEKMSYAEERVAQAQEKYKVGPCPGSRVYLRGFWEIWVLETQFVCPQLALDSSPLLQDLEAPRLTPPTSHPRPSLYSSCSSLCTEVSILALQVPS